MTVPLTREQRIRCIVETLRPTDPGSWGPNIVYVTAEFDSYDDALRAENERLRQLHKEACADYQNACQAAEQITAQLAAMTQERDIVQNELCTAQDQIPPDMEGETLSVVLIKFGDERRELKQQLAAVTQERDD